MKAVGNCFGYDRKMGNIHIIEGNMKNKDWMTLFIHEKQVNTVESLKENENKIICCLWIGKIMWKKWYSGKLQGKIEENHLKLWNADNRK